MARRDISSRFSVLVFIHPLLDLSKITLFSFLASAGEVIPPPPSENPRRLKKAFCSVENPAACNLEIGTAVGPLSRKCHLDRFCNHLDDDKLNPEDFDDWLAAAFEMEPEAQYILGIGLLSVSFSSEMNI